MNGVVAETMKVPNPMSGARSTAARCAETMSAMSPRR
jgi:hypothetical protein